jgi:hypothetical protein
MPRTRPIKLVEEDTNNKARSDGVKLQALLRRNSQRKKYKIKRKKVQR